MKKMIKKFGKLITASFIVMGIGIIIFLLTPLMLYTCNMDTDIPGFLIVLVGLIIFIIGLIRRKKLSRVKLAALVTLVSVLSIPILFSIVWLIYYLATGKDLGI